MHAPRLHLKLKLPLLLSAELTPATSTARLRQTARAAASGPTARPMLLVVVPDGNAPLPAAKDYR
jgi:hypothetical protein